MMTRAVLGRAGMILGATMYLTLAYTWMAGARQIADSAVRVMGLAFGAYCLLNVGHLIAATAPRLSSPTRFQFLVASMMPIPFFTLLGGGDTRMLTAAGPWIGTAGAAGMIVALHFLGARWSIVPGFRQIVRGGPYRWVRHPLYSCYPVAMAGFLLTFFSTVNAVVVAACVASLGVVVWAEELTLAPVPEYAAYRRDVPHRFVPGIF